MGKITDVVRCWVRRFYPSLVHKNDVQRFESVSLFAAALRPRDIVEVNQAARVLNCPILVPGSLHEVLDVEITEDAGRGRCTIKCVVELVGRKRVLACWFVPEIPRKK